MSDPRLRIRDYHPKDFEVMYQIDQVCFSPEVSYSRSEFFYYLNTTQCIAFLAEGRGGIAGFVLAHIETPSIAHVVTLDVVPEMRRHKIGTKLMDQMHEEMQKRGMRVAILEVSIQNTAARRLYEKLGYRSECLLPGYYAGREDACRMRREIGHEGLGD